MIEVRRMEDGAGIHIALFRNGMKISPHYFVAWDVASDYAAITGNSLISVVESLALSDYKSQ